MRTFQLIAGIRFRDVEVGLDEGVGKSELHETLAGGLDRQ